MKKVLFGFLITLFCLPHLSGQILGIDALRDPQTGYPQLMAKFGNELEQKRADYFFVIDVSGSMNKYQDIVVKALNEFFSSLQDGDYVNVIHFGAEAEVVNGCYGTIDRKKIMSLSNNTNQIYFNERPSDPVLRERLWNYTDLDNAMHTLANEMHQLGLNNLKFVFIITDFNHEPSSSRRGQEKWNEVRQQFEKEQNNSNVNIITLQLPGSPTHLQQVRDCFPASFTFQTKTVADGSDLASWFTRLKNNIMLDRFKAIVSEKVKDANLHIVPKVDINGKFELNASWQKNELFDSLQINSVSYSTSEYKVSTKMPVIIVNPKNIEGKLINSQLSYLPKFRKLDGSLIAVATYATSEEILGELKRLGIETVSAKASCDVKRIIFCHPWSFGWCLTIIIILVCYLILVLHASRRNRKMAISGLFSVERNGKPFTGPYQLRSLKEVSIGNGGNDISVSHCSWQISIFVKSWNAFLHPFKKPIFKIKLLQGNQYSVNGRSHHSIEQIKISKYTNIDVDGDRIIWNR